MPASIKEDLESKLQENSSWTLGCPGIRGLDYQQCLDKWKVSKIIILRKMVKDLEELEAESNELCTLVKSIIVREIAVKNWQSQAGTFPIWNGIFSRAKNIARTKLSGKSPLQTISEGLFNGKKTGTGATSIQSAASVTRSRTIRPGSHDSKQGGS